ncbi:PREDICTED: WASH complex subunit FAM21C-like isoform X4 [Elephantulus edwardii]|uniref:WASH complex subunit FAM21C-like isoform X4 n=1 Tax=Elephantulus edwardii TaxID=28737 RepID=UPI0003F08E72|nr:PREDICTED: WASH complex subunit FAM21C-like isoform X4 [Elephantulus edwardii]
MNGTTPDPEQALASEPVWERPWSVEEIRRSCQSWSLAADAGLLQFLQEFSQQTISRTHEIKKQVDGLIRETKATDCRLHNVFNDFLMLSNTQFIENRVYDEEVEEPVLKTEPEKTEQEKTREQKEVDLISKVQEAVNYGLQVLDSAFEQLDIKAGNSDSEEEDANERVELILEPKDLYIDRPLPYLIGSKLFMEQEDVGLGELSSEEGSVGSDRGSFVDSEEKEEEVRSDEDFTNQSDNDQNQHTAQLSEEEDDDDGCDLFADSEKEEDDIEDAEQSARPNGSRPTSFADELVARIKGNTTSQVAESQTDEDDNLFAPPKLTDEDFSPFGSRGGLFSGGKGLFDEEDEVSQKSLESDLFTEIPKDREVPDSACEESSSSKPGKKIPAGALSVFLGDAASVPSLKEPLKPELSTAGKSPYLSAPTRLFDDDDEDDDFFASSSSKPPQLDKVKSTADIVDDEEGDLFKEKALPEAAVTHIDENKARADKKVVLPSIQSVKPLLETKTQKGLFSDEEDSEDLFSSQSSSKSKSTSLQPSKLPTSVLLFDDDEEDNLFGTIAAKNQTSSLLTPSQEKTKLSVPSKKKVSALLFSSDEEDQWSLTNSQTNCTTDSKSKRELRESGIAQDQEAKKVVKKTSLFDMDDEDDLFAIAKDSQKKIQRVSLLFEDDADSGSFLFGAPSTSILSTTVEVPVAISTKPAVKFCDTLTSSSSLDKEAKGRIKTVLSLFDEEEDKTQEQSNILSPQREVQKNLNSDARPKSTGVFQDEELLFSHKLQKDNDPDVDLFTGTKKPRSLEPHVGSLFEDDEDDDLFSSAKLQPLVPEKKVVQKDLPVSSFKNQKHPESTQGIKENDIKKLETPQANLVINPATLLPSVVPQVTEAKPVLSELALSSSQPESAEAGVSFDLPAQADTLHSANKSRVKVRGRRRPQTRAARRLAAQESSETEDISVTRGSVVQLGDGSISPDFHQPQHSVTGVEDNLVTTATLTLEGGTVPKLESSPFVKSLDQPLEDDLFKSEDVFSKSTESQSIGRTVKEKTAEAPVSQPQGHKEQSSIFSALDETGSDDDLFQSVKPKPAKKVSPFPLLEDEDDLFTDQKGKKNESKSTNQQDAVFKAPDIFEDDIFATEAVKPSQKTKKKEKTLESNLFDDNIDIFANLTVKPKEKPKKKVETKSIFDDDMDDIFSGTQPKATKPKSRSPQAVPESRAEHKVSNIFDDPLNAFGGQ